MLNPFRVAPVAQERVWGGTRLGPPHTMPIGELWVAGPGLLVTDGPHAGRVLDDLAAELGPALVGSAAPSRPGPRFPLLVKLLDSAAWLSVQVH
ncbi:MAG: type I phosphomannose isomerase catalytic subunit, partial [Chloroflexota bacterium]